MDDILYAIGGFNGDTALDVNEQYLPLGYGTVPPDLQVLSPENTTYTSNITQLVLSVNRPITWIGYSLDGQDNVTINGNVTLAVLTEGSHNIKFFATDLVGNTGYSETIYFEITPFPTVLFVAVAVTIIITTALLYLLLKRRKSIRKEQQK